jgi:hypothetical protein
MMREPTLGERVLLGIAVAALIAWCLVVIVIALGYTGHTAGATWLIRAGLLAAGGAVTSGLVRLGISTWHRAVARPLPVGRGNRWLARQPGWRLAVGCWALYGAPELGTGMWLSYRAHRAVASLPHIAGLLSSAAAACVVALMLRVLWRRQADNASRPADMTDLAAAT